MNNYSTMDNCTLSDQQLLNLKNAILTLDNDQRSIPEIFNCLASKTRVKVLILLKKQPEMSVCDIASVLNMNISAVSHQLRCLRDLELVHTRRAGKKILYSLSNNKFLNEVLNLV